VFHLIDARLLLELELVGKAARAGHAEELLPLRAALDAVLGEFDDRSDFIAADEAFHLEIARLAGNPVLLAFLRSLQQQFRPIKEGVLLSAQNRQRTDQQHIELYRCLLEGRAEDAQLLMREHVTQGRDLLLAHLRTMPTAKLDKPKEGKGRVAGPTAD
jgi:GntR family transcriptional repressor for pyruvate dehydrogenase complex